MWGRRVAEPQDRWADTMKRTSGNYVVVIVLDPLCGERIIDIGRSHDIWIAPSKVNREAADKLRKLVEHESDPPLVSMWSAPRTGATEEEWLGILQDIDMHHGQSGYSDPVVTALEVIGAEPQPHVVSALRQYGYTSIKQNPNGFFASKVPSKST